MIEATRAAPLGGAVLLERPGALKSQPGRSIELRGGRSRGYRVPFSFLGLSPFSVEAWVRRDKVATSSVFSRKFETAAHERDSLRITG